MHVRDIRSTDARRGIASTLLAGAIVGSYVVVSLLHTGRIGLVVHNQSLLKYGGVTAAALAAGEWWRLLTSQFLHVYLAHAALNAAAVAIVGIQIQRAVGTWRLVLLYLCAGIAGQLSAVVKMPSVVATGASQAVLGIAAGSVVLLAHDKRSGTQLIAPLGYIVIQVALDLIFAGVVKLPHIVSFTVGACVAAHWRFGTLTQ